MELFELCIYGFVLFLLIKLNDSMKAYTKKKIEKLKYRSERQKELDALYSTLQGLRHTRVDTTALSLRYIELQKEENRAEEARQEAKRAKRSRRNQ